MRDEGEFLAFVASVFGTDRAELSLATAYGSIPAWDSVMHLRLVMEVEERYGVDIPMERVPELKTLGAFYELITR